jgi:hypothetical protein
MPTGATSAARRHRRYYTALLRLASPDDRTVGLAVPEDFWGLGARLLASLPQRVGAGLLVEAERERPSPTCRAVPFRVVRCEGLPGGGFLVDGLFSRPLSAGELRELARHS